MVVERPLCHFLERGSRVARAHLCPWAAHHAALQVPGTGRQFPVSTPLLQGSGPWPSDLAREEKRCGGPGSPTSVFFCFMAS